jgi:very-short-patch-repair endonuclease
MIYSRRIIEAKQNLGASLNIKVKAKELRKNQTVQEKALWNRLRNRQQRGKHFRRHHPYNIYILDFYCFESSLAIEVDGEIHLKQKVYDLERTRFLESSGLMVLRFNNEDIEKRIDWVIKEINKFL